MNKKYKQMNRIEINSRESSLLIEETVLKSMCK